MDNILLDGKIFRPDDFKREEDLENLVIKNAKHIFGENTAYFDIKKKIKNDKIASIPDGYLVDLAVPSEPRLYIVENELASHDPYRHIGQQILKFAIAYRESGRKIKQYLLEEALKSIEIKSVFDTAINVSKFRNIDDLLETIIFEKDVGILIVIDQYSDDLQNVLSKINMKTEVLELCRYKAENETLLRFTPFQAEIRSQVNPDRVVEDIQDIDTIVVPAREEGFNNVFIGENCWRAIRISASMLDRIKYIAAYQIRPISAITHVAEVASYEKLADSGKYKVVFSGRAKEIPHIKIDPDKAHIAPQAPRYTSYKKLMSAKKLSEVFK